MCELVLSKRNFIKGGRGVFQYMRKRVNKSDYLEGKKVMSNV